MESRPSSTPTTPLAARVGRDADPARIAGTVGMLWREIDDALSPVIGHGGVAALYQRSVHEAQVTFPWLTFALAGVKPAIEPGALESLLATRTSVEALACGSHLLQQFHGLLETLLGASLTERLLEPVWSPPPPTRSAQEPLR